MAEPGWYPDPEGAPGRFRYWDGHRWAAGTVDSPPVDRSRRLLYLGIALLAVVVIVAAVVILVRPDRGVVADSDPPRPARTGWDDSGPTPTPTPTSASPSAGSKPTAETSSRAAKIPRPAAHCPAGDPEQSVKHADDGRVHGGQLSFTAVSGHGFGQPKVDDHYGWWYDEHAQTARSDSADQGGRTARVAIGSVAIRDGYRTAAQAAKSSMKCVIDTSDYADYTDQHKVDNNEVKVSGQSGRELITDVTVRTDDGGKSTDRIRLIVVDAGAPGSFSIFVGVTQTEDHARAALVEHAAEGLKIGY